MLLVKNIIFDLGNVLYDIDFTKMYDEFKKLGVPDFESHFTLNKSDELFFNLEKGFINEHEFCEGFRKLMQLPVEDATIIAAWNSLLIGFRKQSINWVKANNEKYPMYLYSNTNKIHYDYFINQFEREVDSVPFNTLFKKPYYSHEMGQRKPDPASFIYILEKEGLVAAETLFIDDNEPNIIAAASVGLQVLHLTEGMTIEKEILAYL
ncbi:MAG: hypothetical protein RL064_1351 [Bacteroidota bacterium]|jgi:putative hydrolase of the HAD superfamily